MSTPNRPPERPEDPLEILQIPENAPSIDKFKKNPLVPVGALLTAAVLAGGLVAFHRGNRVWSQRMMRARIVAQAGTVCALLASAGGMRVVFPRKE
ncbi:hypothetical protein CDCA_CDCA08G2407 [Cyanidium caldarium]|uniref:HIG1 domain-containing protein n=1 Tax=Cyanidium caldarium TaxID=2771 RepID=A0AAV9IVM0_CYACA|nr:hypothetical protein CDCA_CDCA08G2407 [Cyanidium caldarium]